MIAQVPNPDYNQRFNWWRPSVLWPVAWVLVFALGGVVVTAVSCFAQGANCISVRVLDADSGMSVKGVRISVWANAEYRGGAAQVGKTDKQGVMRFCLNDPIPTLFTLDLEYFSETDPSGPYKTKVILDTGNVARNAGKNGKFHDRETPVPGEIVVFGKRWWWIDRRLGNWP